jgi:hypothetical protein
MEGGCHKTFCDTAFDEFVTVPEQQVNGKQWTPSHRVMRGSQKEYHMLFLEHILKVQRGGWLS